MSSKGGISSSSSLGQSALSTASVKVSVTRLGREFGGLFGGIWSDVAISANIESASVDVCESLG